MKTYQVWVVAEDASLRSQIREALNLSHYAVREIRSAADALTKIQTETCDLVLLDSDQPDTGLELLRKIKETHACVVAILVGNFTPDTVAQALAAGAYNCLGRPTQNQKIVEMVERALAASQMIQNMVFSAPIALLKSGDVREVFSILYKIAALDTPLLIRGENGTGKECVARAIHYNSSRKDEKLVALNCASIPEELFESELFGRIDEPQNGADPSQMGKLQYVGNGTVFLNEIGSLSPAMQDKLYKALDEKKFTPVGSSQAVELGARVTVSTTKDLEAMVQAGLFREDLFLKLSATPLFLPPLRERKQDIEKLVWHFVVKYRKLHGKNIEKLQPAALELILNHSWPGNIRELENAIEHAVVGENGNEITPASLPGYLQGEDFFNSRLAIPLTALLEENETGTSEVLNYKSHKERFEREFIIKALTTFKGRINQTALHAQIPKKTLLRKLQKYKISAEDYRM